jgi:CRP-like cAMP-binding protein
MYGLRPSFHREAARQKLPIELTLSGRLSHGRVLARQAGIGSVTTRKFSAGGTIYRRGDAAASAFEVRDGRVRLTWPREGGPELPTVLGRGQVFGAAELISGAARAATAEALGEAVVDELGRDELARLCADDPEFARAMFQPAFERLRRDEDAARAQAAIVTPPPVEIVPPRPAEPFVLSELRLKPAAREVSRQMNADGIRIASLPFHVGRRSVRGLPADDGGDAPIDLTLEDARPYSLSRRHFAIEGHNGGYIVRDCNSHYGTIVNGSPIGAGMMDSIAPLVRGENRIVAGRSISPFRFTLTLDGA